MNVWWWVAVIVGAGLSFWLGTKVPALRMFIDYLRKGSGR